MHPDSIEKTAFIGPDGLYEWLVMPFGLANAPSEFMRLMADLLESHIENGYCIVFIDDILIFSKTLDQHEKHVQAILDSVRTSGFRLQDSKCSFGKSNVPFLGFEVSSAGVTMNNEKIRAITDWPDPLTPRDMRSFIGLSGVYRRFVPDFAKIALPLLRLITLEQKQYDQVRADTTQWKQVTKAIDFLKAAMVTKPALALPEKGNQGFLVRTDASDFAIGATLRQLQPDPLGSNSMKDRIIAYFSRKLHDAETRYSTYDKELLGIKDAIQHWRYYLHGRKFRVETDHSALQHILQQPKLTGRQMRLFETLQEYDFEIQYYPGARNYIQDALSRRPDYKSPPLPRASKDKGVDFEINTSDLEISAFVTESCLVADNWIADLKEGYISCPYFRDVLIALGGFPNEGHEKSLEISHNQKLQRLRRARQFELVDGLIYQRSTARLGLPKALREQAISEAHDSLIGGHFGIQRTTVLVSKQFYWKGLAHDVKRYVRGCAACARAKPSNEKPYVLLQSLEVPSARWQRINIDFVTKLPLSDKGNDTIITFIDGLTKRCHWVATKEKDLSAERFAEIFISSYFRLHGLPESIVSDRDPRFTSDFWQHLTTLWQTKLRMSTAFHPQADGLAEKANQTIERYLRTFVAGNEQKWDDLLPLAEFSYNAHVHKVHGMSPFEADLGYTPRMPMDIMAASTAAGRPRPRGAQAVTFATHMNDIVQDLTNSIKVAQEAAAVEANKKRQPHTFKTGDKILLNTRNLPLSYANAATENEDGARLSRTLQQRYAGPFTLGQQFGNNAFELTDMPEHLRVHKSFNVDLFKPCTIDNSREQAPPPPIRVTKSGKAEYVAEKILDWEIVPGNKVEFLTLWEGFTESEATWEPLNHLASFGGRQLLEDYIHKVNDNNLSSMVPAAYRPPGFNHPSNPALPPNDANHPPIAPSTTKKRRRKAKHWVK